MLLVIRRRLQACHDGLGQLAAAVSSWLRAAYGIRKRPNSISEPAYVDGSSARAPSSGTHTIVVCIVKLCCDSRIEHWLMVPAVSLRTMIHHRDLSIGPAGVC